MTRIERNDVVRAMLRELEARSPWEAEHADRVAVYSVAVGTKLGFSDSRLLNLRYAATLHNIGKLDWPDALLNAKDPIEQSQGTDHPALGAKRLQAASFPSAAKIVLAHHERIDGSGYPRGLTGRSVSPESQIVGLCETFDILSHGAPWQAPVADPWRELLSEKFDPALLTALRQVEPLIQPIGT